MMHTREVFCEIISQMLGARHPIILELPLGTPRYTLAKKTHVHGVFPVWLDIIRNH